MKLLFFRTIGLLVLLLAPETILAQQPKIAKIGFVSVHALAMVGHVEQFRTGLRTLGWPDSRIDLEVHFTDGSRDKARESITELIQKGVDVLVLWTTPTAQIGREVTQSVPVVMITSDPVAAKLVPSLAHPGGNLTGLSLAGPDLAGKRLELLREIMPGIRTIAFLGSSTSTGAAAFIRETEASAEKIGIKVATRLIDGRNGLNEALFQGLRAEGAEAVIVQPVLTGLGGEIVAAATMARIPVIADYPAFAEVGALVTLGVDEDERVRRAAYFVDRILKGANPGDLPVEQPTTFQLVVNTKTAKALGITIPEPMIFRADRVIE
jgi:putative tryptophan/tyrosine transport system substrate-binding protein